MDHLQAVAAASPATQRRRAADLASAASPVSQANPAALANPLASAGTRERPLAAAASQVNPAAFPVIRALAVPRSLVALAAAAAPHQPLSPPTAGERHRPDA